MEPEDLGRCCLGLSDRLVSQLLTLAYNHRLSSAFPRLNHTVRYNLFASNVINTSIAFVYFPDERWPGLVINLFTLLGSVCGQLLFGYLADRFGRTRLYGIELVLVIVSTIGVATSSYGYNDMSFLALFAWVSSLLSA